MAHEIPPTHSLFLTGGSHDCLKWPSRSFVVKTSQASPARLFCSAISLSWPKGLDSFSKCAKGSGPSVVCIHEIAKKMAGSAFVGQPTNTEEDYWIARAILLALGMVKLDAHKGVGIILHRPPPGQYHFETRGPGIIAGASVSIAIMIAITGTRLGLRYFKKRLIWGWDDWLIIPGAVGNAGQTIRRAG